MRLLSLALFAGLVACGQTSTSNVSQETSTTSAAASAEASALSSKVVGTYAMRVRLTSNQTLPLIGKSTSSASIYKLGTIAESAEGYTLTETPCEFSFEGGTAPLTLSLTKETVRSGQVLVSPIAISEKNGVVSFERDFATVVFGAELANADLDALPTSGSDSRVVDSDKDGQAGVTARANGKIKIAFFTQTVDADIYFVQRSRTKFSGTLIEDGHLSGTVVDQTEQSLLGSSNILLTLGGNVPTVQDPDSSKSSVDFIRVSEQSTCDTVAFKQTF